MAAAVGWRLRPGDRVVATTWGVAQALVAPCRSLGVTLHVVFHGSDLTRPALSPGGLARVCRGAAFRWTVSVYLGKILKQRGYRSQVLPAPVVIPPDAPPRGRASPERWLTVARATPLKGGDRFVRLVAAAEVTGTVVGDGPELPAWRALADRLGARLLFTGRLSRPALAQEMRRHDLIALLPRAQHDGTGAEGLGLVLLEAGALGTPAVGCKTGGVPEAVGPGLVLDDPEDLSGSVAAIRRWWGPDRGAQMRQWVTGHHGAERVFTALIGA